MKGLSHDTEPAVGANNSLQLGDCWFNLQAFSNVLELDQSERSHQALPTFFGTLSQVFFKRKIGALVKAAQICSTPLKLCRQRQMSATAVHFSIAAIRAAMVPLRMTTETSGLTFTSGCILTSALSRSQQVSIHRWSALSSEWCARRGTFYLTSSKLDPETLCECFLEI